MKISINDIARLIGGRVVGDGQHEVSSPAKIEEAAADQITFLANNKYLDFAFTTQAGCIVLSAQLYQPQITANCIIVDDAYQAFSQLLQHFQHPSAPEISDRAFVHPSAVIGARVHIYPNVYIGERAVIGDDSIIYPNVTIYAHCVVGQRCIMHAGAVIGSDGFGFAPTEDGAYHKIPQLGNVIIEDDCEIGANTCIDRATMGSTIIRKGVKLDNLIQVAHNVEIGEHTVIAAQTGISGSTKIGHHNRIGGQVGFVGHISVAPYTQINAQSAVASHVKKEGLALSGTPAIDIKQHFKATVVYKDLPELARKVRELEMLIQQLKNGEHTS
ncbi:MAG: UDP-3-O-(3-hydroxymyristoyl)glucosamine N-acyltransferase [Chitinophagales bacterium]|nr:UDP-3-O-(3-hydroxymyristoyl)glucosamine N-acyltransferase [Chitinophagales bacterium]